MLTTECTVTGGQIAIFGRLGTSSQGFVHPPVEPVILTGHSVVPVLAKLCREMGNAITGASIPNLAIGRYRQSVP